MIINFLLYGVLVSATKGLTFPPGFKFGAATSAYQIEGSWNISDKSESIWDRFTHTSRLIRDNTTGDVACNSYNGWERDIEMAAELGLDFFRFSISWPRILPTGFSNYVSEEGKNHYDGLIDGLLQKGVEPVITLYHWDIPQRLQDLGGWTNPLISDWFAEYARVVYSLFADRVKIWITINEPLVMCDLAFNTGTLAPGIIDPEFGTYLCNKHTLVAHAKAWRIYDKEFRPKFRGQVSLTNQLIWYDPLTANDTEITETLREYVAGRFSHPIFSKKGGWPPIIERKLKKKSHQQGYFRSRLPSFTKDEIKLVKGTYDFYGLNYYTSRLVRTAKKKEQIGFWPVFGAPDLGAVFELYPNRKLSPNNWIQVIPEGLRRLMVWLKKQYGNIPIFVIENGYCDLQLGLNDLDRVDYYKDHLKQVMLAIKEDGVNVTGFTAWTLMDNFEWYDGYTTKFGLYEVDFNSPDLKRTPRASAKFYKNVISSRSLDNVDTFFMDEF